MHAEAAESETEPAGQAVQALAPAVPAKLPAGQSLQLAPPGALVKRPGVQAVQAACPSEEKVPDGHAVQLAALSLA